MREKEQGRDTVPSKKQQEESELKLTSTKKNDTNWNRG